MTYLGSPKIPQACAVDDIREVVDYVHRVFCADKRKLFALGFSLGGNGLAKLAGQEQHHCKLEAIFCCSSPIKFEAATQNITSYGAGFIDYGGGLKSYAMFHKFEEYL